MAGCVPEIMQSPPVKQWQLAETFSNHAVQNGSSAHPRKRSFMALLPILVLPGPLLSTNTP